MEKTIIAVKFCDHKRRITDNRLRYYRTSKKHGLNHLIEVPYFEKRRFAVVWEIDIPHYRVPFGAYIGELDGVGTFAASVAVVDNPQPKVAAKSEKPRRGGVPETYPLRPWCED